MQTNVSTKPFQMRIVIVLNTHGLQSAVSDEYFYLWSKYHRQSLLRYRWPFKVKFNIIDLFNLAYSQLRWVLLLKMSFGKSFSWLLLRSLLEKIDTTVLNTHGFKNWWQILLSRDSKPLLFLFKIFFSPSHDIFASTAHCLNIRCRSSYQTNEDEKKLGVRFNCD